MKWPAIIVGVGAVALGIGVWFAGRSVRSDATVSPLASAPAEVVGTRVGNRAPPFSIRTVDGVVISSDAFRGRKAILFTSLATWCTACFYEAEQLAVLYPEFGDRVEFFSLSIDPNEDRLAIESFRINLQTPWGYALATAPGAPEIIQSFGLSRFDITYVIDRDGIIRYVDYGPTKAEHLRGILATL